jgi:hypothetical protein
MANNVAVVVYDGLVTDGSAIQTAINATTYDATQEFITIPQPGNSVTIIQVYSA